MIVTGIILDFHILCVRSQKMSSKQKKPKQFAILGLIGWLLELDLRGREVGFIFWVALRPKYWANLGKGIEAEAWGHLCSYLSSSGWLPSGFPDLQGQRQLRGKPVHTLHNDEHQLKVCDEYCNGGALRCKTAKLISRCAGDIWISEYMQM